MEAPTNTDDVIDSRDVIERIAELEEMIEEAPAEDDKEELEQLKALATEASQYADDWDHGEALIRDSYFEQYAEELADDVGAIDKDAKWPLNHIDWEAAADELKQDYTSVDFGDVTYWVR